MTERMVPAGRADTNAKKVKVAQTIKDAWSIPADVRLGQLIYWAVTEYTVDHKLLTNEHTMASFLFSVEDAKLAEIVYDWAVTHYGKGKEQG